MKVAYLDDKENLFCWYFLWEMLEKFKKIKENTLKKAFKLGDPSGILAMEVKWLLLYYLAIYMAVTRLKQLAFALTNWHLWASSRHFDGYMVIKSLSLFKVPHDRHLLAWCYSARDIKSNSQIKSYKKMINPSSHKVFNKKII